MSGLGMSARCLCAISRRSVKIPYLRNFKNSSCRILRILVSVRGVISGFFKSVIALLPAAAAVWVACSIKGVQENRGLWIWVIIAILILGGVMAGSFVTGSKAVDRPNRSHLFISVLFAVVLVAYVVIFF